MSVGIEKLTRFLDALKVSEGGPSDPPAAGRPAAPTAGGAGLASSGGGLGQAVRSTFPSSTEQFLEQTAAVASLASSITQQGQTLLSSKREPGLSKAERMAHCQAVASLVMAECSRSSRPGSGQESSAARAADTGRLLSVAIETLLLLADDAQPDVRMTADEALNRIVRGVSSAQVAKVLVEQMKARVTGSARLLRAALARFAVLAKHIRVQKGRAYMQTLVPLLCCFSQRPEENIHESVATALSSICPALGHFATDSEMKLLLSAYQGNLGHPTPAVRRAAAQSLLAVCKHSRKPAIFLGCLVALLLRTLLQPAAQQPSHAQVLGCLVCLRHVAPELWQLCAPSGEGSSAPAPPHDTHTYSLTLDQLLQVYQLAVHHCSSTDHNTVTASLELLRALLENAPPALVTALVSPAGVPRCLIDQDHSTRTTHVSRTSSCGSLSGILGEEELSLEPPDTPTGGSTVLLAADSLEDEEEGEEGAAVLEEDRGGGLNQLSQLAGDQGAEVGSSSFPPTLAPSLEGEDLYSSIEIGKLSEEDDQGLLFSGDQPDDGAAAFPTSASAAAASATASGTLGSQPGRSDAAADAADSPRDNDVLASQEGTVKGQIGSVWGSGVSGSYVTRFLCCRFLLAGHSGSLLGERAVRVSAKVLALNCLTRLLTWLPEMMHETLFLGGDDTNGDVELVQRVWDVSRYSGHSDPSVCAAAATLLGHYLRAAALNTVTHDTDQQQPDQQHHTSAAVTGETETGASTSRDGGSLLMHSQSIGGGNPTSIPAVLSVLQQVLSSESAVTVRGAVAGLRACLPTLLHCLPLPALLPLLPHLVAATQHPYWLIKVEVCELLCQLPIGYIDFLEQSVSDGDEAHASPMGDAGSVAGDPSVMEAGGGMSWAPPHWGTSGVAGQFSHRVLRDALLPLLPDTDQRVRTAAVTAIVRLLPQLQLEGSLYRGCVSALTLPGHLLTASPAVHSKRSGGAVAPTPIQPYAALLQRQQHLLQAPCDRSPVGGYKKLPRDSTDKYSPTDPVLNLEALEETCINDSLSKVVHLLTTTLFTTEEKNMKAGCVHALCELSQRYHPVLHGHAWGCRPPHRGVVACLGLLQQLVSLTTDLSLAGDLSTQAAIITLSCSLLAGVAVANLEQQPPPPPGKQQQGPAFAAMGTATSRSACSVVLLHVARVLALYQHVLEDVPLARASSSSGAAAGAGPVTAGLQPPQPQQEALSPLKRRVRGEAADRASAAASAAATDSRSSESERDRKGGAGSSKEGYSSFSHLAQYCRLYEVVKSAHSNYKMSVCVLSEQRVCCLLQAALRGLCCLLEVLHTQDILPPLHHLLHCCTAATHLLPQHAVHAAQQLVKCLFGSNLASQWHSMFPGLPAPAPARAPADCSSLLIHAGPVQLPLLQLHREMRQLQQDPLHLGSSSGAAAGGRRAQQYRPPQAVRPALSSYIRLFEPLVIRALNLYTVSSSVHLQRSVLQLLVCLVHIRVNYCLLDSNQIFLRYVIKQLENIEEGHLRHADVLIPSLFEFLVAVSYERQHSRSIIGVPKIIQLCDGLLASGQPPLSHCVLALGPLVEEVFVSGAADGNSRAGLQQPPVSSGAGGLDAAELATKREVMACTLLRLAHYHQVVRLIGVMVQGARQQSPQRWQAVSGEVADVLLPLLATQQINLHTQESVSTVLEVLSSLCPSVFSPPDALLKALLTSPYALESTRSVEVWVSSVVVVLRVMLARCSPSVLFERLAQLGLTMHYIADGLPSSSSSPPPPAAAQPTAASATPAVSSAAPPAVPPTFASFSPIRRKLATQLKGSSVDSVRSADGEPVALDKSACNVKSGPAANQLSAHPVDVATPQPTLYDPLNVTQPNVKPETAVARFLLEVLRVCCSELRCVWYLRSQCGGEEAPQHCSSAPPQSSSAAASSEEEQQQQQVVQPEQLLVQLAHQLMLIIAWMSEHEEWRMVSSALRAVCEGEEAAVLTEVSECLVSVRAQHPALSLLCCHLHTLLDLPGLQLWPHVLRSRQRKTPAPSPSNSNGGAVVPTSNVGPSSCLPLQYLRQAGLLLFAAYVSEHLCEEEWLAWLLVQHTGDVVALHQLPSLQHLLHAVHGSAAASALLLHSLNTRGCTQLLKAEHGEALLATVSNVHASQSGTLVLFLLQELLTPAHFLHVASAVTSVLRPRLQLLLTPRHPALQQLTQDKLAPYTSGGRYGATVRSRSLELAAELDELLHLVCNSVPSSSALSDSSHPTPAPTAGLPGASPTSGHTTDLAWYLRLVTNRCSSEGGGSAEECSQLLLHLDQQQLLTVMKGSCFNVQLLQHTLHAGFQATLQGVGASSSSGNSPHNASANSSPNSNRSNSSNTSSVSSGSTTSSTSGGEHLLYSTSRTVMLHHLQHVVSMLPKPHYDYRPGGGNKYSERMNQLLSSGRVSSSGGGQLVQHRLEQLAPTCTLYLNSLPQLPWRAHVQSTHAHTILRFALLTAEYLQWSLHQGTGSAWRVALCLSCVDAALASLPLSQRLAQPDYSAYVCSMVASLHYTITYMVAPAPLPRLVESLWSSVVSSSGAGVGVAAGRLMQLVLWLEQDGHRLLPPHVAAPARGLVMGLGRCPCLNAVVRCPPELWCAGWEPSLSTPSLLPPVPPHLLQEPAILKQFIFRVQLLGWLNRQQFEETWMALLSVLNTGATEDSPQQEQAYRDQSVCICVRGLSGLLLQTLLLPTPGNPHTALRRQSSPSTIDRAAGPVNGVLRLLSTRRSSVLHLIAAAPSSALMQPCSQHLLPVHTIAAGLSTQSMDEHSTHAEYGDCPCDVAEHTSQLAAMGIDLTSCTHFLHDLFAAWITPGKGLCSSVVCEVAKCLCVLVDIFTSPDHQVWVVGACVSLHASHPPEDHTTHHYLVLAAAKALAVCRAAQLTVGSANSEGVLHMVESGLKSANVGVRTSTLHGLLHLLQPAAAGAAELPSASIPAPPETNTGGGALRLLQGTQLPRTALSALTSHMKGTAGTVLEPKQDGHTAADPFLTAIVQLAAPYALKACDTSRVSEGEAHSLAAWDVCLLLVERHSSLLEDSLPSTALHLALTTAAAHTTTPALLHKVLQGVERLLLVPLVSLQSSGTSEVVLKLVSDLVQHGPPAVSLPALPLLINILYSSGRRPPSARGSAEEREDEEEPERLLQQMERLGVVFERIKTGYLHEAWLLAGLLATCLLDLLPASQVLNKTIMEYISSQQPHPHLLAATLFQVFEGCMQESGEGLVQEWVLMSLGNFTRREPVSLAVWCITCFLVAASRSQYLRAAFASVVTWPAQLTQQQQYTSPPPQLPSDQPDLLLKTTVSQPQLHPDQLELFCLAAQHFASALPSQHHKEKFREVFSDVAANPGSPFAQMLLFLDRGDGAVLRA